MSGATPGAEEARARPLSGGLGALLAWLRRHDAGSSDSLSSVGSDRTVASFAFLAPERCARAAPRALPPPEPPTDSYKKRLRDRSTRLQRDRDLTLHRKYGLLRDNCGYDAFSLPSARKASAENRDPQERERRAASECVQRRAAHVPGKRRAPPPPARALTLGARRSRKRPAPQPPRIPFAEANRSASITNSTGTLLTQITSEMDRNGPRSPKNDMPECKPEKHVKKEVKDCKVKSEKSFLKQIFDNKKRNSTADMIPERILPSISELDKQAAEIIESCKLKALNRPTENVHENYQELQVRPKGDMWFCTRCLRKYNDSVVTCVHCVDEQKRKIASNASNHCTQTESSSNKVVESEDKQKLKEMLKEIKDSLPKRPKHDVKNGLNLDSSNPAPTTSQKMAVVDAPTLRIGSKILDEKNKPLLQSGETNTKAESTNKTGTDSLQTSKSTFANERVVVTQPLVLQHLPSRDIIKLENFKVTDLTKNKANSKLSKVPNKETNDISINKNFKDANETSSRFKLTDETPTSSNTNLNTPLKISALLNPNFSSERHPQSSGIVLQTRNSSQLKECGSPTLDCNTKPIVSSSNSQIETGLKSQQNIGITVSTALNKIHKEHSVQKTTTTTQTPIILNSVSKQKSMENSARESSDNILIKNGENMTPGKFKLNPSVSVHNSKSSNTRIPEVVAGTIATEKPIEKEKDIMENSKTSNKVLNPQEKKNIQPNPALKIVPFDQHLKRRDLINQLEQSIAKGDQQAAAEAASKLAQLRLSCSVLSFSSQILNAPSTSSFIASSERNESILKPIQTDKHVAVPTATKPETDNLQKQAAKSNTNDVGSTNKSQIEKKVVATQSHLEDSKKPNLSLIKEQQTLTEPSTSKLSKTSENVNNTVSIEVWIEDREAARGPVRMNVSPTSVMGDLRRQADASLGLAAHLQRWIVGRTLCTDDSVPLNTLAGPSFNAPFYLCLVEPEPNKNTPLRLRDPSSTNVKENIYETNGNHSNDVYSELMLLEKSALVSSPEDFECGICMEQYAKGQGVILRECVHIFCRSCLSDVVKHSEDPVVCCPAMGCPGVLQEREIRALVPLEEYERWLAKGLAAAESGTRNAFHCRTRDCTGWALCEPGVTRFPCPVCRRTNCVSCQALHEGDTCEQYRAKQQATEATNSNPDETDEGTKAFLDTLISRGEALECPECKAIITKKWGCDWIKCSACKTEICWVTRGPRWGPGGRGDTSAGCRCGVDGKRCHPSCGYCH